MTCCTRLPQSWVIPIAVFIFLAALCIAEIPVLSYTHGVLVYPMDDAFIHMAVAKNLALHGVWGPSRYAFVSASSSVLYTLLLGAIFGVTGPHVVVPLIVNIVSGVLLLISMGRWLEKQQLTPFSRLLILLAVIFLLPLPYIARLGMEHTLQVLIFFLFTSRFCEWLGNNRQTGNMNAPLPWNLVLLCCLLTAVRYEGIFPLFIACLMLLYYRQIRPSLVLGFAGLLPLLIFGIYSLSKGNYFFPNPVLLKSTPIPHDMAGLISFFTFHVLDQVNFFYPGVSPVTMQRLLFLLPALYFVFRESLQQLLTYRLMLFFLSLTCFFHLVFANTNWFYRYEACLIGSSIPLVGTLFVKYGRQVWNQKAYVPNLALALSALVLVYPFLIRSTDAWRTTSQACKNVFDQDYSVSQFLHTYYDTVPIGLNDLGCISYYSDANNLDLVGLGNIQVARSKREGYYSSSFLDSLVTNQKIKIVVVFDRLLQPALMGKWHKIATWHFNHIIIPGDENYSFYAVDSAIGPGLKANLKANQKFLPNGVSIFGGP
jgi:hypothetical protein